MTAVDVGADIVELHLGVGSASVGLKMAFWIISKWLRSRGTLEEGLKNRLMDSRDLILESSETASNNFL